MLQEQAEKDMQLFRLIGQERRFQVLLLLCSDEMSHEDICLRLGKPMGVYKHLRAMVDAGLLIRTDITRRDIMYRADPKVLEDLSMRLTEMSIDAHEITFRKAQKGTPLGDQAEAEHEIKEVGTSWAHEYAQRVVDRTTSAEEAEQGMGKTVPGTKYDRFEGMLDEDREREADMAEEHGPHD